MIAEESFVDFKCPYCGEPVSFPGDSAGHARECPGCLESLIVPDDGSDTGRKPPVPIPTPRLVLRRLSTNDWKDLLEVLSDEEMFRYLEGVPLDEERVVRWLESDFHVRLTTPDQTYFLGLELKGSGKLIGYLGLNFVDAPRLQANFHICVGLPYQRKGLASEAVGGLLQFCFQGIKLHRVAAVSDARNLAACRLLEKAAFRREAEFVKNKLTPEGEWANTASYAILAEEYKGK